MYYIVIFIAMFCGSLFGSAIVAPYMSMKFAEMGNRRKIRKVFKQFEKEIQKMDDKELERRVSAYYDWKKRMDDDYK